MASSCGLARVCILSSLPPGGRPEGKGSRVRLQGCCGPVGAPHSSSHEVGGGPDQQEGRCYFAPSVGKQSLLASVADKWASEGRQPAQVGPGMKEAPGWETKD